MKSKDFITEEDFNARIARRHLKSPQKDSPGDSATDSAIEVDMGINFEPENHAAEKRIFRRLIVGIIASYFIRRRRIK